jgi:hypothetical protein
VSEDNSHDGKREKRKGIPKIRLAVARPLVFYATAGPGTPVDVCGGSPAKPTFVAGLGWPQVEQNVAPSGAV